MSDFDRPGIHQPLGVRSAATGQSTSTPASPDAGGQSLAHVALDPGSLVDARVLDHREAEIVRDAVAMVTAHAPSDALILGGLLAELNAAADLLKRQRPLRRLTALGGEARNESTLIDHLCTSDGLSGDLMLPLKAAQSRTYLLTKINALRGFMKATLVLGDVPGSARITRDLRSEVAQSIYTLLAEELFLALLRMPNVTQRTKRGVADQLITVWDDAALEIDDFAPLLESAWHARNRIHSAYGTLLGATETFRLVREDCSPEVLEFFGREGMSADESAAFEEFLFNMTSEELATLRHEMQRQGVPAASPAWAAAILGRPIEELERAHEVDPMALYRSYQRRQLAADFRVKANAPGPRRTAEAYLMCYLVDQEVGSTRESFEATSLRGGRGATGAQHGMSGDGGGVPPSSGSGGSGGPPRNTAVTRYVDVSCPTQVVRTCDRFPVTVALLRSAPDSSAIDASFEVQPDLLVDVLLLAAGLHVIGNAHIQIATDGARGVFFLRPDEVGQHSVTLDFAQGGNPLGTVAVHVEVVERDVPYDATHHHARLLHIHDGAEPPDYVLLISYEAGAKHALRFCLRSRDDFDQGRTFSPVRLYKSPEEFMHRKYRDLDVHQRDVNLVANTKPGTPRAVPSDEMEESLEKLGYQLWTALIPPDFKSYYAKHRHEWRDRTFVIVSDEPSIPWELVRPYDDAAGTWEDPDPWCLTLRLSRWLRRDEQGNGSAGPPSRLSLTQLVTLIPSDTGLPAVRAESEYLRTLVESHGVGRGHVPAVKRQVLSALSAGSYDWLHAAAHGSARDPADQTISVWLENGEALTPDDIVGPQIERHIRARRPAFVLNACTVARSGWELTGMSGWANQLIKVGAGLFLAPLWSVTDDVAQVFVQTFYNELANNACVADAMREARMTARTMKGDPTWMAYVLFAHPNARVAFGTTSWAPP